MKTIYYLITAGPNSEHLLKLNISTSLMLAKNKSIIRFILGMTKSCDQNLLKSLLEEYNSQITYIDCANVAITYKYKQFWASHEHGNIMNYLKKHVLSIEPTNLDDIILFGDPDLIITAYSWDKIIENEIKNHIIFGVEFEKTPCVRYIGFPCIYLFSLSIENMFKYNIDLSPDPNINPKLYDDINNTKKRDNIIKTKKYIDNGWIFIDNDTDVKLYGRDKNNFVYLDTGYRLLDIKKAENTTYKSMKCLYHGTYQTFKYDNNIIFATHLKKGRQIISKKDFDNNKIYIEWTTLIKHIIKKNMRKQRKMNMI